MTGLKISYELRKRGWTQTRISHALGVTQSAVSQVIHDKARSRKIRIFISAILGKGVSEIWRDQASRLYE